MLSTLRNRLIEDAPIHKETGRASSSSGFLRSGWLNWLQPFQIVVSEIILAENQGLFFLLFKNFQIAGKSILPCRQSFKSVVVQIGLIHP